MVGISFVAFALAGFAASSSAQLTAPLLGAPLVASARAPSVVATAPPTNPLITQLQTQITQINTQASALKPTIDQLMATQKEANATLFDAVTRQREAVTAVNKQIETAFKVMQTDVATIVNTTNAAIGDLTRQIEELNRKRQALATQGQQQQQNRSLAFQTFQKNAQAPIANLTALVTRLQTNHTAIVGKLNTAVTNYNGMMTAIKNMQSQIAALSPPTRPVTTTANAVVSASPRLGGSVPEPTRISAVSGPVVGLPAPTSATTTVRA